MPAQPSAQPSPQSSHPDGTDAITGTRLSRRKIVLRAGVALALVAGGLGLAFLPGQYTDHDAQGTLAAQNTGPNNGTVTNNSQPLGTTSFAMASLNVLGAGHTDGPKPPRKGWLNSAVRLDMARTLLKNQNVDLVGLQEMHPPQVRRWQTYTEWASFPNRVLGNNGSDNVVSWRTSVFTALAKKTVKIPYFNGRDVNMPYVRLEHRASGTRLWMLNVHPPANIGGNHQKWRDLGVQRMATLVNKLKAEYPGEPIYTTGDMNDGTLFFCPFVKATGAAAANGGSSTANLCTPPRPTEIDWIMGTAPNTFTNYAAYRTPYVKKTTDHPIVVAQANVPTRAMSQASAKRVVLVSVEGLRGANAQRLAAKGLAPGLAAMARNGAGTYNARIAPESSRVLPNLMSAVTGRRVWKSSGGHGVSTNAPRATVHQLAGSYVSTMFDMAHNNGRTTGVYSSSTVTNPLRDSWSANTGGADPYGTDNGRSKLSTYRVQGNDVRTVSTFISSPKQVLSLVHLTGPRLTGEKYGFASARYDSAVRQFDKQLQRLRRSVAGTDTVVILTSTSGGTARTTSQRSSRATYRVPMLVTGPGVVPGGDLYALNPAWRAPGGKAATWADRPLTSAVSGNLALAFLKLPPLPGSTANATQSFNVLRTNS